MVRTPPLTTVAVLLIASAAFFVRTYYTYSHVFTPGYVNFQTPDSWYHMRLIEHTVRNFPHRAWVDPYLAPWPARVELAPLFDLVVAAAALLVGLGAPSPRQIEVVAAFAPPLLGALTVVPAYAIGRRLFGPAAGLFGAAMLAIAPGHFLARSLLGYADHHVLEVLLAATTMALLTVAIETDERPTDDARWTFAPWAALAGLALAAYLMTWASGAFLLFVVWAWLVLECALDALRHRSSASLVRVTSVMLLVALGLMLALQDWQFSRTSVKVTVLGGMLGTALLVTTLELALPRWRTVRLLQPVATVGLIVGGAVVFARLAPDLYGTISSEVDRLRAGGMSATAEALPLFLFAPRSVWELFGSSLILGLGVMPVVAYHVLTRHAPAHSLMLVWSLVMLAVTLRQNRFGYYLALNLALLSGHLCAMILDWSVRGASRMAWARAAMGTLLVAVAVVVPNAGLARAVALSDAGVPRARQEALAWLRSHSPEPFADPNYYLARYDPSERAGAVDRSVYTIMTWWDYGYDVIRIARRVPTATPTHGGAMHAGRFFLATQEEAGSSVLRRLRSRYVLVTEDQLHLPQAPGLIQSMFGSMSHWAGQPVTDFVEEVVDRRPDGVRVQTLVFHPAYYLTMASRLYLFDGRAVTPENSTWVISYADGPSGGREIVESRRFSTHESARRYLERLEPGRHALVGRDPLRSPVPVPALRDYVLVHESADGAQRFHGLPSVKVFEFRGTGRPDK